MTINYTIPTRAVKVTVSDTNFLVWGDFIHRGTIAYNTETKEAQWIREGGYLTNELSIRRAISITFGLPLYRTSTKKTEKTETTKAKKVLTEEQKAKKAARAKARREARKAQANV